MQIGMIAGEASGDLLGAHLIAALQGRRPDLAFTGIGGPKMQARGLESEFPMERLAVRGFAEVVRHYRGLLQIRRTLTARFLEHRPDAFVGIDAPDFNLGLERKLKSAGIPTVHYVSPSVWAWRGWRVRRIGRSADHVLALFPFEPPIYRDAGIPVTYVGHPLADMIPLEVNKPEARSQLRLPSQKQIIALLPGSRASELTYMAETFIKTARRLSEEVKDLHFVCPIVSRPTRDILEAALRTYGGDNLSITILFGHSHEALAAADLALVASGTATLEAALLRTPMVITYKMSPLSWILMKRMAYMPYVGLPNILAGEFLVPELLQNRATPGALAEALISLMGDGPRQRQQLARFGEIHQVLRQNTAEKAADIILDVAGAPSMR